MQEIRARVNLYNQFIAGGRRFAHALSPSKPSKGVIAEEPEVCQTANGEWVPYPKGRRNKLAFPVVGYGVDAVSIRPGENEMDCLYNQAKGHYLLRRPQLINHFLGKWVAFGSDGFMLAGDTEDDVRPVAELLYPINRDEYYVNCIGKEIICGVNMDSMPPVSATNNGLSKQGELGGEPLPVMDGERR